MIERPFRHVVFDGLLEETDLCYCASEFPTYESPVWQSYGAPQERGKKSAGKWAWGPATRKLMAMFYERRFCDSLSELTGIQNLEADDLGGGMHCSGPGARLDMHTDFSRNPTKPGRVRVLNLLLFLNEGWKQEWGGTLYLGANREVAILPLMNRMVVFETSAHSWHGHPEPIVGEHYRKSLACYYYAPAPEGTEYRESTTWQD